MTKVKNTKHSGESTSSSRAPEEADLSEDSTVSTTNVRRGDKHKNKDNDNTSKSLKQISKTSSPSISTSATENEIERTLSNSSLKKEDFNNDSTVKANNLKDINPNNRMHLPSVFMSTEAEVPVIFDDGDNKNVKTEDDIDMDDIQSPSRIRLGICAMDKKARSKPMSEILSRLDKSLFEVVIFGDPMILNNPVTDWPIVNVLIAFFSANYPLGKAQEYVALRKPFVLNDLDMQDTLKDRRKVYDLLQESGIDVPRHVYLSLDGYKSSGMGAGNGNNDGVLIEQDDHIEVNGVIIEKPFVEKPIDADDHNIAIYYPSSAGGGCKKTISKNR